MVLGLLAPVLHGVGVGVEVGELVHRRLSVKLIHGDLSRSNGVVHRTNTQVGNGQVKGQPNPRLVSDALDAELLQVLWLELCHVGNGLRALDSEPGDDGGDVQLDAESVGIDVVMGRGGLPAQLKSWLVAVGLANQRHRLSGCQGLIGEELGDIGVLGHLGTRSMRTHLLLSFLAKSRVGLVEGLLVAQEDRSVCLVGGSSESSSDDVASIDREGLFSVAFLEPLSNGLDGEEGRLELLVTQKVQHRSGELS